MVATLEKFHDKFGKLTSQTFISFHHATVCLLKIVNLSTNVVTLNTFLVYFYKMTHLSITLANTGYYQVHSTKSQLGKFMRVNHA